MKYVNTVATWWLIFFTLSLYLFFRRGYYDLYIANKALAGSSAILLGIVLLIGTLTRLYQRFDGWLSYRKDIGILAFIIALIHGTIAIFLLPDHFPFEYYLKSPLSFGAGMIGLVVLVILFIISFESIKKLLQVTIWWKLQYLGVRLAVGLTLIHVLFIKILGWVSWYQKGGSNELAQPFLPPAGLLVMSFLVFVVLVRLVEFSMKKRARAAVLTLFFLWLVFVAGSFGWGAGVPFNLPRP